MKMEILVTKEKFMRIVNLVFLLFGLFASCQSPKDKAKDQDKFSWNAGISAPKNYIATPFVEYLYLGKSVAGASTNVGTGQGWGVTSGGYTGGDAFKPVPDSVFVEWNCGFDLITYKGGFNLPRKKMLELFNKGAIDPYNGSKEDYSVLIAGTAPGGNVTIWMQAGGVITEVAKFKAKKVSQESRYDPHTVTLWTSTGQDAKDILRYINFHGVPYEVWETGEKEYNYDIGFSSEDGLIKPQITTFYTKEGSWYQPDTDEKTIYSIDKFKWDNYVFLENNNLLKRMKLPVQIELKWRKEDEDKMYRGILIMPQNLDQLVSTPYRDSTTNKQEFYNRIIIGAYKGGNKGVLWLTGRNQKKKLMEFIMLDSEDENIKSYYSLPKGFAFPKWKKGKEPLKTPEIDYWQEK